MVRNLQANAIVEQINQLINIIIQTFELEANYKDKDDPLKERLAATTFAVRTYHTTQKKTPGQLSLDVT